jgi:hypothetical protein
LRLTETLSESPQGINKFPKLIEAYKIFLLAQAVRINVGIFFFCAIAMPSSYLYQAIVCFGMATCPPFGWMRAQRWTEK